MQAWQNVQVIADGEDKGRAGVILDVDSERRVARVQLDETAADPETGEFLAQKVAGFPFDELVLLAR
jgi:hypothetical protein